MSDTGRKDLSDKVGDKMTPNQSKSTTDSVKDTVTGMGDKVARDVQPDSQKSTTQSMADKASREKDSHTGHSSTSGTTGDKSMLDKAKDAVGMGDNKH